MIAKSSTKRMGAASANSTTPCEGSVLFQNFFPSRENRIPRGFISILLLRQPDGDFIADLLENIAQLGFVRCVKVQAVANAFCGILK